MSEGKKEMTLKEVENELDDLTIRILQLMNDNINCKLNLERAVRSGCMDLAKTRYILGSTTSVSAMKIPTDDLTATTTVVSSPAEDDKRLYELNRETVKKASDNEVKIPNQDPIKWFGILVPSNLKQAQSWFHKALDLSVQSANIYADLNASIEKYETLKKDKMSLKSEIIKTSENEI